MEKPRLQLKIGTYKWNTQFCTFSIWIDFDFDFCFVDFEKQFGESIHFVATNGVVIDIKKGNYSVFVTFNGLRPINEEYFVDFETFYKITKAIEEFNKNRDGK